MPQDKNVGMLCGIVAGMSFGLIPLFSIPVIHDGMGNSAILFYRFLFGSMALLAALIAKRINLRLTLKEALGIALLSLCYVGTALSTLECYKYLSSGVATALVYTDPVWCVLIAIVFLHERISLRVMVAVTLAVVGVSMLAGVFTEDAQLSWVGVMWGLLSGLAYALYLIFIPQLQVKRLPSLKLTFYVFCFAMLILGAYNMVCRDGIQHPSNGNGWCNLLLLGLIPTALSNICVTASLKRIDSTIVAILGALEPVTAMVIGILALHDPFSMLSIGGTLLILLAVYTLTLFKEKPRRPHRQC